MPCNSCERDIFWFMAEFGTSFAGIKLAFSTSPSGSFQKFPYASRTWFIIMSVLIRAQLALLAAVLVVPRLASAQTCSAADKLAGSCLIHATPASTTVSASAIGVAGTPVTVAARYLGGIAYFQSDVYFFQGFFNSGFNQFDPLANSANYTLIGGKPENQSTTTPGPWISLPGSYPSTQELVFGLRVNTYDFSAKTHNIDWYFTGYGYARQNNSGRASQDGSWDEGFANIFLNGGAPVSDQSTSGMRSPPPASWSGQWNPGNGYFGAGGADAIVGWEDNRGWSDGDFNDAVIALDFATVPEPSSVALVAVGLVAMATAARRRRNS